MMKAESEQGSPLRQFSTRSAHVALIGLFLLASLYMLSVAREFLMPVASAIFLTFLLDPIVHFFGRAHIPRPLAAAIVLTALMFVTGYGVSRLAHPAAEWIQKAPETIRKSEEKIRGLLRPAEQLSGLAAQIQKLTVPEDGEKVQQVRLQSTQLTGSLLYWTKDLFAGAGALIVLLYFLLATDGRFLSKLMACLPNIKDKKRAQQIADDMQESVSNYLLTVTMINVVLGLVVGFAMALLGMPNPALWGVMAGLMPFVPYLGALMGITILALVAFTVFDSVGQALLPPLVYFACAYLEGGFITPQILGRRLQLNPVSILLSVMLWGWLWGVVGAVLAVPILTVIKVLCDYNPSLAGLGEFLGVDAPPRKHGALVRSWLPSWASKVFRHDNRTTVT